MRIPVSFASSSRLGVIFSPSHVVNYLFMVIIFIFHMSNDAEHLFMNLVAICISLMTYLLKSFPFFIGCFFREF